MFDDFAATIQEQTSMSLPRLALSIGVLLLIGFLAYAVTSSPVLPTSAAPAPTLMPTAPIVVPAHSTLRSVEPVVSGDGNTVTITYNITSVESCVGWCSPLVGNP